jgi:hypothetical protein
MSTLSIVFFLAVMVCLALLILIFYLTIKLHAVGKTIKCLILPHGIVVAIFPHPPVVLTKDIRIFINGKEHETITYSLIPNIVNISLTITEIKVEKIKNIGIKEVSVGILLMTPLFFQPWETIIIRGKTTNKAL